MGRQQRDQAVFGAGVAPVAPAALGAGVAPAALAVR